MTGDERDTADGSPGRSRQLYRAISSDRTTAIIETDLAGNVRWVSPTVQDLLGWTPDDLRAMHPSELLHPLDFDRVDTLQRQVVTEGTTHDAVQCMVRTVDGSYRAVSLHTELQYDAGGHPIGVVTSLSDTHDRDSALRALATLSQANRTLVRATDEAELLQRMCETVVDTGRYLFAWYGRPVDDADKRVLPIAMAGADQGYLDEVTISWADNEYGRGPTGRSIRERQTRVSNNHVPDPDFHPWLGPAERRGFHASISLPVLTGDVVDGALVVYASEVGAFDSLAQQLLEDLAADLGYGLQRLRDVADLVRTTREAEEQRERLQATIDSQFDPFIVLEGVRNDEGHLVDLRYAEANAAALTYNAMSREEMIGARLLDLFPGQLESGPMKLYFEAIETGEPVILDDYSYGNERLESDRRYDIRAVRSGDGVALTWRDVTNRHAAAQRLADSERRFRLLAENSSDVVLLGDQFLRIRWISQSVQTTFGVDPDEVIGRTAADFIHPDDVARLKQTIADSDAQGDAARLRYRWRCADGTYRWVESVGRLLDDDGTGQPGRVVGMRDIDAQMQAERDLAAREERYRLLAENASDVVWQIEPDGRVAWASPSVTRVLGWSPDELVGRIGMDLIHVDDRARAISNRETVLAGSTFEGEFRVLRQDGGLRWMALAVHPVATPQGTTRIVALRDVQDEVAARQRLEFALGHDQLTGLTTRHGVIDRITYVQAQLTRWHLVGVLCVGIDALSEVNEALTHAAGDIVLTTMAARLVAAAGHPDLVGRGSGDEFIVLLTDLVSGADAGVEAERIRSAVHGEIPIGDQQVFPTVCVGIATGGYGGDAEQLLRDASLALRKAKNSGRDRCEFADPGLALEAQHRLSLEAEIRDALRDDEIVAYFQPIVRLASSAVVGYEALARWVRPTGVLLPVAFIPVAERSSLIHSIDITVMRRAVIALARLPEFIFVSVNVTVATLARTDYADAVTTACAECGVDPARLHIEVTETMLLDPNEIVTAAIERLADVGVRWYIDDFGTGYASISSLRDLPIAGIKLDHSFTFAISREERTSFQLAKALVGLAGGLELDTVAEGVETAEQAELLSTLGWTHGQGWLYGKAEPLPLG